MRARHFLSIGLCLIFLFYAPLALAVTPPAASTGNTAANNTEHRLWTVNRPSECGTNPSHKNARGELLNPANCLYLEEPIGGRPNYDLFVISCEQRPDNEPKGCQYKLWGGEAIQGTWHGPVQAIIAFDPNKQEERGFMLFYNYLGLIYKYASGVIVGMAVLFVIIGGIQMTTSAGDTTKFDAGKKRITQAITGMIVWFLASLILYTINPTFFAF